MVRGVFESKVGFSAGCRLCGLGERPGPVVSKSIRPVVIRARAGICKTPRSISRPFFEPSAQHIPIAKSPAIIARNCQRREIFGRIRISPIEAVTFPQIFPCVPGNQPLAPGNTLFLVWRFADQRPGQAMPDPAEITESKPLALSFLLHSLLVVAALLLDPFRAIGFVALLAFTDRDSVHAPCRRFPWSISSTGSGISRAGAARRLGWRRLFGLASRFLGAADGCGVAAGHGRVGPALALRNHFHFWPLSCRGSWRPGIRLHSWRQGCAGAVRVGCKPTRDAHNNLA